MHSFKVSTFRTQNQYFFVRVGPYDRVRVVSGRCHRFNPKFIWASVYSCTHWLRPRNSPLSPAFGLIYVQGRSWSAKIDDMTSLCDPLVGVFYDFRFFVESILSQK
jgi:hypothetical protein